MKYMAFIISIMMMVELGAQDTTYTNTRDTTTIELGNTKIIIVGDAEVSMEEDTTNYDNGFSSKNELTFWSGIDIGVNGYLYGDEFEFDAPEGQEHLEVNYSGSRSIAFNIGEWKARLISDNVGIYTGLGVQFNNYKFQNDLTIAMDGDSLIAFENPNIELRKNKLKLAYLTVPLMLEFNTSRYSERSFHLSAGVVGGMRIGSKYKQKYKVKEIGEVEKAKLKGDYNVAPFKLDAMARVGFGWFSLFGSYSITELFQNDQNPELHPFTAGISFAID